MEMDMGHFLAAVLAVVVADDKAVAIRSFLDSLCKLLRYYNYVLYDIIRSIRYDLVMLLGYYQCMPFVLREDIHEGEAFVIFVDLVTRNFAFHDFAEYAVCHLVSFSTGFYECYGPVGIRTRGLLG